MIPMSRITSTIKSDPEIQGSKPLTGKWGWRQKRMQSIRGFQKSLPLICLALPGVIVILIVSYLPISGIFLAFKNINLTKGLLGSDWIGFENFRFLFQSENAARITFNTLFINSMILPATIIISVILSFLLYDIGRTRVKLFQAIYFFPYFLSWVVIGYVTYIFLNNQFGVISGILRMFGMDTISFYSEPKYWPFILVFMSVWKNLGYTTIIFYTGLLSIDPGLLEAASIDGASKWQTRIQVILPQLYTLIFIIVLLNIGKIFNSDFGLFYFLPRDTGALYDTTDVIDTYVYRSLRVTGDFGMAAAAGLYQSLVGLILVLGSNAIVKRISPDSAIH